MSSNYPEGLDVFEVKQNAESQNDPNGDYVMADDVNDLQDSIVAIQGALGKNPQGNDLTVADRISKVEGMQSLTVPGFLVHYGAPIQINGSSSVNEAVSYFSKFNHVVLGPNYQQLSNPYHSSTVAIIEGTKADKNTKFYGYINCSISSVTLAEIQTTISQWVDTGVDGIYLDKIGYDFSVSRTRQNEIIDSVHQWGLSVIVNAENPDDVLNDLYEPALNPSREDSHVGQGDFYHFDRFAVDTSAAGYVVGATVFIKLNKLLDYRTDRGVKILATSLVGINTTQEIGQGMFDYAHTLALLASLDGFHTRVDDFGVASGQVGIYENSGFTGNWYTKNPEIKVAGTVYTRETGFGRIIVDTDTHTFQIKGASTTTSLIRQVPNSIDGSTIRDSSIDDSKIISYRGDRLIDAINKDTSPAVIDLSKIEGLLDDSGGINQGYLEANVLKALNAAIGFLSAGEAAVGVLTAGEIRTGALDADRIVANVIKAVNIAVGDLTADNATISNAAIGELTADHIVASVIEAINLSAENITAEKLKATVIEAINISAQDINADRIRANVVTAINMYAEYMQAGSARINVAAIGELTADHIKASVIDAINLNANFAKINGAKIGELEARSIEAIVIHAINLSTEQALINSARIGDLTADKITASVIDAINLSTVEAVIGQAKIGDLDAEKIKAGSIDAGRMTANVIDAVNLKAGIATVGAAIINSAAIGVMSADHIQAAVIGAINISTENATINAAKIGVLEAANIKADSIDATKLTADSVTAEKIKAGAIETDHLSADVVTAEKIAADAVEADAIKAGAVVAGKIAADAVEAGNIAADTITTRELTVDAVEAENIKAESIIAEKIAAGAVETDKLDAESVTAEKIAAGAIQTDKIEADAITAEKISADAIEAEHISAGAVETDALAARSVTAEKIAVGTIIAENIHAQTITSNLIQAGAIIADLIAAEQIKSSHISTEGLNASVIKTGKLDSVLINTDTLTVKHVAAGVINASNIVTEGLDASVIKSGYFEGERIKVGSIDADRLRAGTITATYIAANAITSRNIQAGSITGDTIQAGSITAQHISTKGLDANIISVFGRAGETLIGDGYLRVDGFDVGVIQSDNLVANGLFMTASSDYGYLRQNPEGEALLGSGLNTEGAHELWRIDLTNNAVAGKLLIPGRKPAFIAIGNTPGATSIDQDVGRFAYITVQGDDTLAQVDLHPDNFSVTTKKLEMGKGPGRIIYTGNTLGDHKHFFVVNTDPKDVNAPDSFIVVDAPPSSDDLDGDTLPDLYVHHQLVTGNTPYDVVLTSDKLIYITLADQGDILIIDAHDFPTMYWKPVGAISISPHGMDNYHGGLDGRFGLGYATGGDGASAYVNEAAGDGGHHHGGYGAAISALDSWNPHGIAASTDETHLYVADATNGELILIKRIAPGLTSHDMGDMTTMAETGGGHNHGTASYRNEPKYGGEIHNRIKIGDAPEFIKVVGGKIFVTLFGSDSIAVLDEATIMEATKPRKLIPVGVKPLDITTNAAGTKLFVSVNGENRVAVIDVATETVSGYIDAGANVMGIATDVAWDGREYLYLLNNGGSSALSFVYPQGNYFGDPYLGLEGAVEYQGAEHWIPNRSDWVYEDAEKKRVRDSALVEFRVNEPIMNEGGYARLAVSGRDSQQASIQQDLYNVSNFSNGNTLDIFERDELTRGTGSASHIFFPRVDWVDPNDSDYDQIAPIIPSFLVYTGALIPVINESLAASEDRKTFTPSSEWVEKPAPIIKFSTDNGLNFTDPDISSTIIYEEGSKLVYDAPIPVGTKVYAISYSYREKYIAGPQFYSVYYNKFKDPMTSRVEFQTGVVPADGKVEARYSYVTNTYFKNHNGSIMIAIDESSSRNFTTEFSIEEFVPKFIVMDNQTQGKFTPIEDGVNEEYTGMHYSFTSSEKSVRTRETPVAQITTNGTWVLRDMDPNDERASEAVGGKYPINVFTWDFMKNADGAVFRGAHNNPKRYVTVTGTGVKSVTVDMVKTYMLGHCDVWMEWDTKFPLGRTYTYRFPGGTEQRDYVTKTYKNVKVESSEDGVTWFTWVNSPSYNTNWFGNHTAIGIEPEVPNGSTNLYASVLSKPARYMRFSSTGWEARDPDTGAILLDGNGQQIKGDTMDIAHCHGYADWEVEYDYVYPAGSELEGEQMASNGKCIVTTDIPKAYVSIDIKIEYTSWWYMTYIIGPEFGEALVKMPTVMAGDHSLFYEAPFQNKIEHRHIMSMPPGQHRVLVQQNTGKISLDRVRFEDYQYSGRSTVQTLTNTAPSTFTRYKIVSDQTKNYIGKGRQTTEGAFDKPYINADTHLPDRRVPLKYRFKVKASLNNPNSNALLSESEHGIAYVTSAIFEAGKQSTSWRMSQTADSFPGTRIEAWNPSFPHKTGIQSYHLANGAVRGTKILPAAIMDWHISPYARIGEYKLDLNYATHYHGHFHEDGSFLDNKSIIDSIHGWGIVDANKVELPKSGVLERMARADHWHPEYVKVTELNWNAVIDKPIVFPPAAHTHLVSEITDINTYYYNKEQVNTLLLTAGGGDVSSDGTNVFTETNTFTNSSGLAIKIQPGSLPALNTVLFAVNSSTGVSLLTINSEGKMVINSDLVVTGTTTYNGTNEVVGDYDISGNLTVGGNVTLGDSITDQTTVKGNVRVEGAVQQVGKAMEVARFPVYGVGGDPQFQTDDTTFQNIIDHYWTFNPANSCIPTVPVGVTRTYKILVAYGTISNTTATLRIVQQGTQNLITSMVLPAMNGTMTGLVRTYLSSAFSATHTGHTSFDIKADTASTGVVVKYIEVIAYDTFS